MLYAGADEVAAVYGAETRTLRAHLSVASTLSSASPPKEELLPLGDEEAPETPEYGACVVHYVRWETRELVRVQKGGEEEAVKLEAGPKGFCIANFSDGPKKQTYPT